MAVEYSSGGFAPAAPPAAPAAPAPAPVTGFTPIAPVQPSVVPATPVSQPLPLQQQTIPPVAPAAPAAPAAPSTNYHTEYGLPAYVENSPAAARAFLDAIAERGFQTPYVEQQPQAPAAPAVPAVPAVSAAAAIELDLDTTDPKVVAAFKAQQAQIAALLDRTNAQERAHQAQIQQQQDHANQQIFSRARNVIDNLASGKYGVTNSRNPVQRVATEGLIRLADSLIAGYKSSGLPVPLIETVLQQALYLDGHVNAAAAPAAPAPPVLNAPGVVPQGYGHNRSVPVNPFVAPVNSPIGAKAVPLDQDPDFFSAAMASLAAAR